MKNLVIDHVETPGKRLWALRESMRMDEEKFAALLDMTRDEYRQYEYIDKPVPSELLVRVASRLAVSIEWLNCECPMLPVPKPDRRKSS